MTDNSPVVVEPACATPDDCPNGPEPHTFVPAEELMCCCRQPWETL